MWPTKLLYSATYCDQRLSEHMPLLFVVHDRWQYQPVNTQHLFPLVLMEHRKTFWSEANPLLPAAHTFSARKRTIHRLSLVQQAVLTLTETAWNCSNLQFYAVLASIRVFFLILRDAWQQVGEQLSAILDTETYAFVGLGEWVSLQCRYGSTRCTWRMHLYSPHKLTFQKSSCS